MCGEGVKKRQEGADGIFDPGIKRDRFSYIADKVQAKRQTVAVPRDLHKSFDFGLQSRRGGVQCLCQHLSLALVTLGSAQLVVVVLISSRLDADNVGAVNRM